jgi:hypothetical protein
LATTRFSPLLFRPSFSSSLRISGSVIAFGSGAARSPLSCLCNFWFSAIILKLAIAAALGSVSWSASLPPEMGGLPDAARRWSINCCFFAVLGEGEVDLHHLSAC